MSAAKKPQIDPLEEKMSLQVVRGVTKLASSILNIDNIMDNHPDKFPRKMKQDILNFNEWAYGYTDKLMVNLTQAKETLILDIQNRLLKFEEEVYVEDPFTHEMVFFLAKIESALNNLKKVDYPHAYVEYLKPIISRAENLMSKNHICSLGILDQPGYKQFVAHFDFLGYDLIPEKQMVQ